MASENPLESELKALIIKTLSLEDMSPNDIDSHQPLFVEGLGLDSIDALELSVAIGKTFGVKIEGKNMDYRKHFASVRHLAEFIAAHRRDVSANVP